MKFQSTSKTGFILISISFCLWVLGCNDGSDNNSPPATATPSATNDTASTTNNAADADSDGTMAHFPDGLHPDSVASAWWHTCGYQ